MPVEIYKDKKKTTMKDFDDWLREDLLEKLEFDLEVGGVI